MNTRFNQRVYDVLMEGYTTGGPGTGYKVGGYVMNSRGREAEGWVRDAEKAVRDREEQAVRSRNRANQRKKRS